MLDALTTSKPLGPKYSASDRASMHSQWQPAVSLTFCNMLSPMSVAITDAPRCCRRWLRKPRPAPTSKTVRPSSLPARKRSIRTSRRRCVS